MTTDTVIQLDDGPVWVGTDDALGDHDAVGVAELIRSGEISAAEAVDAAIERAERAEPLIAAFAATDFDRARERARGPVDGRFGGLPTAIKDQTAVAGLPLRSGSQALANVVYAGRLGNRDPGDGWRFRGRGLKQLTGRENYADACEALARPYLTNPELVAQPEDACMTAAWFWHVNKLNVLADSAQWDAITRVVNGPAMRPRAERRQYAEESVALFA